MPPTFDRFVCVAVTVLCGLLPAATATATAQPGDVDGESAADNSALVANQPIYDGFAPPRVFVDLAILATARTVNLAGEDRDPGGASHFSFGLGLWWDEGIGDFLGEAFAEYVDVVGIRIGYITSGALDPEADVTTANDYAGQEFEAELLGSHDRNGRGVGLVLSSWQATRRAEAGLSFRGQGIPEGAIVQHTIQRYGTHIPFHLGRDYGWGFDDAMSSMGILLRYEFQELVVLTEDRSISGRTADHVLSVGYFVDWGILPWLRFDVAFTIGAVLRKAGGVVTKVDFSLEWVQPMPFLVNDHLEILVRLGVRTTVTTIGGRYLVTATDNDPGLSWIATELRLGLRYWF